MLRIFLISLFSLLLVSCGSSDGGSGAIPQPDAYCATATTYTDTITISGTAQYKYRVNGNGAISAGANPIRQAEVVVLNSSGTIIQCGSTDNSGNFSVDVPKPASDYVLRVNSRISNTITKAYVLNNPTDMDHHYIESDPITSTTNVSLSTLTAPADDTLEAGAFNILDKVLSANIFLIAETTDCDDDFTNCVPFTGTSLVKVFWAKGVNPGSYFNSGALSFYIVGASELYILGGSSGDVDNSDTDHFDNSIIIHEYGHFIEDLLAKTDTPGGTHDGDSVIDPRLAWGEGWANFFQAAVLNTPVYLDTIGNISGTPDIYFNEGIETPDNDIPSTMGEGNFREFSITRLLWDAWDDGSANTPATDDDAVVSPFSELWTVFTNPVNGFKYAGHHFRNMGLFHIIHDSISGVQNWSTLRTSENQRATQQDFARSVATSGSSCTPVVIQAQNKPGSNAEDGTAANSNMFASNDFYKIYHSGGAFNLVLSETTTAPSGDLDLYIYRESYHFSSESDIAAKSTTALASAATSATETVNTILSAGYYMINVRVRTNVRLGNSASYTMTLNGANLCPQ